MTVTKGVIKSRKGYVLTRDGRSNGWITIEHRLRSSNPMPLSMRVESPGKRKRTYVGVFHKRKDSFKDASLVFAYVDNKGTFGHQWRRWFTIGQFNLLTDEQRQRWIDVQRRFSHAYEDGRVDVDDWMQASANVCDELLEEGLPQ